jgi:hypothetical protein
MDITKHSSFRIKKNTKYESLPFNEGIFHIVWRKHFDGQHTHYNRRLKCIMENGFDDIANSVTTFRIEEIEELHESGNLIFLD